MTIGNRIRQARNRKGYSQEYVAEHLQLSQGGYRKIETDEVRLKADTLVLLAQVLEVEVTQLLYSKDDKCFSGGAGQPLNGPAPGMAQPAPDLVHADHNLLRQLLESKEAHLLTQQQLLEQYDGEIRQLRAQVAQLSRAVSSLHAITIRAD
jgi:transcriptional regulator with XRE-family HTH domain